MGQKPNFAGFSIFRETIPKLSNSNIQCNAIWQQISGEKRFTKDVIDYIIATTEKYTFTKHKR